MIAEREAESPYIAARLEWHERYGSLVSAAHNWRRFALGGVIVAGVSLTLNIAQFVYGGIYYVPFLVDRLGNTLATELQAVSAAEKADATTNTLWRLVEDIRTVTTDGVQQKNLTERAYKFIGEKTNASGVVDDFYRTNKPQEIAQRNTVDVEVHSVALQSGSNTYQADWTERTRDLLGTVVKTEEWRGWFVVDRAANITEEKVRKANPFGLFVKSISWTRVTKN